MKIPDPKKAQNLKKAHEEQRKISLDLERKKFQAEFLLRTQIGAKLNQILKKAFKVAINRGTSIEIDLNPKSEIDSDLERIFVARGFLLETIDEKIEVLEARINKKSRALSSGEHYDHYTRVLHTIRMHLYQKILLHHQSTIDAEAIASTVLPIIFDDLKPRTENTDWVRIKGKLKDWSNLFSYEETVVKQKKIFIAALAGYYHESKYISSLTSTEIDQGIRSLAREAVNAIPNIELIEEDISQDRSTLLEYEKFPCGTLFLDWAYGGDYLEELPLPCQINANFLQWLSTGDGIPILERLTDSIEHAARDGKANLILDESWLVEEPHFLSPQYLFILIKELGFGITYTKGGLRIDWE